MSLSSVVDVFESGISATPNSSVLDTLVRHQLEIATKEVSTSNARDTGPRSRGEGNGPPKTLTFDMGEYLAQAAQVWSRLTDNLVQGSHVEAAVMDAHEQSRMRSHVSDLSTVVTMDVEHSKLCKIRDLTEKFSRDVQEVWRPCPGLSTDSPPSQQTIFSPFRDSKRSSVTLDVDPRVRSSINKMLPNPQLQPVPISSPGNDSSSDDLGDDEDEHFAKIDMDALKQRGKGSHYCPLGHRCDKGGVDKEGNLVLFDRNSSFAYASHLLNHPAYLDFVAGIRDSLIPS
ncbi:hypothetical protein G7046_g4154 [Stylonectria norvegica]|nr:hypothetical protein G7046_g4154 [Stylonectria norvegica]